MITWLPGELRSWIWCITRTQARSFALPADRELETAARDLHGLWSRPPSGSDVSKSEFEASREILGEAAGIVADKPKLVVVADGALRAIPLGALLIQRAADGQRRRLAETTAVSYRPALNRWTNATPSALAQARETPGILLVGDPVIIGDSQHRSAANMRGTTPRIRPPRFNPCRARGTSRWHRQTGHAVANGCAARRGSDQIRGAWTTARFFPRPALRYARSPRCTRSAALIDHPVEQACRRRPHRLVA